MGIKVLRGRRLALVVGLLLALGAPLSTQQAVFYSYVGAIEPTAVTLAWGVLGPPGNTIGRASAPLAHLELRIDGRRLQPTQNWVRVDGLEPDRSYHWELFREGKKVDAGDVRTLPAQTRRLAFFVIGDFGNGSEAQYRLAAVMEDERRKREHAANPVRFVLSTGDNIYRDGLLPFNTGSEDRHWERKFFSPYKKTLRHIPFYTTLGNHDGNESERRADLSVYLDNFFFPGGEPARYYSFAVGDLAEFFALDTTRNSAEGKRRTLTGRGEAQSVWLKEALARSRAPWKIVYFHHPPFSAGPGHGNSLKTLQHWVDWFGEHGVAVVFNGHEHNLQFSARNEATRGVQYVVTGSGGELREGDVRKRMTKANIAGWAPVHQFLLVELVEDEITITPLGINPVQALQADGSPFPLPLRWRRN